MDDSDGGNVDKNYCTTTKMIHTDVRSDYWSCDYGGIHPPFLVTLLVLSKSKTEVSEIARSVLSNLDDITRTVIVILN